MPTACVLVYMMHIFFKTGFRDHMVSGSGAQNSAIHLESLPSNLMEGRKGIG